MSVVHKALWVIGLTTVARVVLRSAVRSYEQRLQLAQLQDELEVIGDAYNKLFAEMKIRDAREARKAKDNAG